VGTIPLGGRPESCAFDGKGKGYVDLEDKNAVVEFDAQSMQVLHTWPVAPGEEPAGLALDVAHGRLFVGCGNKLMAVVSVQTGKVLTTLPIGEGVDFSTFDPGTQLAFASCGGGTGTVTAVHEDDPDHFTLAQDIVTLPRARTMALDPSTHRLFLVTAEFGTAAAATAEMPHPRPPMVPGSFKLIVLAPSP
jgi:DNA-binding beta-propeller fold protein YncE